MKKSKKMAKVPPNFENLEIRAIAMPKDTNAGGHIFGGWLLSHMDLAGGSTAALESGGRVATVAITEMQFLQPIFVGDEISCYAQPAKTGNTSITVNISVWCRRRNSLQRAHVAEGVFVYVGLDETGQVRALPK